MKYKTVKIELGIHDELAMIAVKNHRTIQDIVNTCLEEKLEAFKVE